MSAIIKHIPGWEVWGWTIVAFCVPIVFHRLFLKLSQVLSAQPLAYEVSQGSCDDEQPSQAPFSGNYDTDLNDIKKRIGGNSDVAFRSFTMTHVGTRAVLILVDGMQNDRLLNLQTMEYLMFEATPELLNSAHHGLPKLPFCNLFASPGVDNFARSVLFGHVGLLVEGLPHGLLIELPDGMNRQVSEPVSEALLRGPRVGFTEVLSENTSLLRRQGFSEQLEMKSYCVGTRLKKDLVVAYIKDIVNPDLLQEVEKRVSRMNIDFAAESGYVEQLIEDDVLSPFQQLQNTERPDRVIHALLEGRVAILLDGTPFALIAPVTFSMLLQSPEDYYERWLPSSLLRLMRFGAAFLALMAPAFYISFISFHPGLIPTELAITIIETRQGVPFPSLIEVLILEVSIEILREAGIRLPKPIGPAMGIVGGLIIGDAAVQAGIVSPFLVIVVAVTAISSFSIPSYSAGITLRMLRFAGMLFAAFLGILGTILFFLLLCSHLSKLKSFGVPYLTPATPFRLRDWKDFLIRAPLTAMKRRPAMMKPQDDRRQS
ncbi:spore germination protein [Paenibacillus sp. 598K]|uniref:spore germination protein n=1 Tax=Paenibacillus sp. 598K TaxID=1117987 RepID=UPI000FFAB429|nr:spore germination protein [Paenibacillus sp. 598K]GBF77142.1 spore germination protein [Paenibacillus sp. 598K]